MDINLSDFWKINLGQVVTIAALFVYWWLSQMYCLVEINACYDSLNNCTRARFPMIPVNFTVGNYSLPLNASAIIAPSNVTR